MNILRLKEKNQAFAELDSVASATTLLNFFSSVGNKPIIRNVPVDIQYSSRQCVTVESKPQAYPLAQGGEVCGGFTFFALSLTFGLRTVSLAAVFTRVPE